MRSILPPSERQLTRSIAVSDTLCHARFRAEFPASTHSGNQPPIRSKSTQRAWRTVSPEAVLAHGCAVDELSNLKWCHRHR